MKYFEFKIYYPKAKKKPEVWVDSLLKQVNAIEAEIESDFDNLKYTHWHTNSIQAKIQQAYLINERAIKKYSNSATVLKNEYLRPKIIFMLQMNNIVFYVMRREMTDAIALMKTLREENAKHNYMSQNEFEEYCNYMLHEINQYNNTNHKRFGWN